MTEDELNEFTRQLHDEVNAQSGQGADTPARLGAFTDLVISYLVDADELQDGQACHHERPPGVEVDGYHIDGDSLDLFVCHYTETDPPIGVVGKQVESKFRRLCWFLKKSLGEYYKTLPLGTPEFDMATQICLSRKQFDRARLFLFTDGRVTSKPRESELVEGLKVSYHVCDIERLFKCMSSVRSLDSIEIDFEKKFGRLIPCLPMPESGEDYKAYLSIFPGQVLYTLYEEYGPRLLELNVRSFLQARGNVNRGIQDTIRNEPRRFFAYNNGISATAEKVDLVDLPHGGAAIRSVRGLQIVNGGQTTASIHYAAKSGVEVAGVCVQVKLSEVPSEKVNELVPLISRFANSQNKVSEADFWANDQFHVKIQECSRRVWTPATDREGATRKTRWFYERARGQYADEKARQKTAALKRKFTEDNPTSQKFTKTDLAKFENTWDQLPHLVSLGAQKNFQAFAERLSRRKQIAVDEAYFKRLVGKAILFRQAEKIVQARQFGGFRANIVTYSLAYLSLRTQQLIDLDRIWREQCITVALHEAIDAVAVEAHQRIVAPLRGANVTEWCKKEECWKVIRELKLELPAGLASELLAQSDALPKANLAPGEFLDSSHGQGNPAAS